MSFHYHPAIGTFHLNTAAPRRVVPGPERHRWASKKLQRGQTMRCEKCGCVRTYTRDYETRYQLPGHQLDTLTRPPCPGPPAPAAPPAPPLPAATAGPSAARDTPPPTMLPGLTTTYDKPALYRHEQTIPQQRDEQRQ